MSKTYQTVGTAKNLGELLKLIQQAVALAGEDADWEGYDDGSIYIHSEKGWFEIKRDD